MTPPEVAALYEFPPDMRGAGQCIAILELGGGYRSKDLTAYFKALKIKKPKVTAVSVAGGHNEPDGPTSDANGEVMLDIEVAGAVAPGAKIAVYFAPNTDEGFLAALNAAVHDNVRKPSVVSMSWGSGRGQLDRAGDARLRHRLRRRRGDGRHGHGGGRRCMARPTPTTAPSSARERTSRRPAPTCWRAAARDWSAAPRHRQRDRLEQP